jgi:phosphohistidine phosphatase
MLLYFLRHGEAGFNAPTDADRELTLEGEHASRNIGNFCVQTGIQFTHAFASPLTRAQQTAKFLLEEIPHSPNLEILEHLAPDSDPQNLFQILHSFTMGSKILLVTHEPFVSSCIAKLISSSNDSYIVMKTTSFACIDVQLPVGRGMGKLQWLISSDIIKRIIRDL